MHELSSTAEAQQHNGIRADSGPEVLDFVEDVEEDEVPLQRGGAQLVVLVEIEGGLQGVGEQWRKDGDALLIRECDETVAAGDGIAAGAVDVDDQGQSVR